MTLTRNRCVLKLINLITKATPINLQPLSISSFTLNSHCIIAKTFNLSSHFRDHTYLVKRKGRAQWGRVARASIAGGIGGEGDVSRGFFHDKVACPIQLVDDLHRYPYNLVNQIDSDDLVEVIELTNATDSSTMPP